MDMDIKNMAVTALLDDEAKKRGVSRSRLLTVAIMNELEIPMEQQVELALGLG
jgi:post-segregation antitoxin (ccd killing protein)